MKKVLLYLDDETGARLEEAAQQDYRSVKSMAEKMVRDSVKRSDGFTDAEYLRLKNGARGQ